MYCKSLLIAALLALALPCAAQVGIINDTQDASYENLVPEFQGIQFHPATFTNGAVDLSGNYGYFYFDFTRDVPATAKTYYVTITFLPGTKQNYVFRVFGAPYNFIYESGDTLTFSGAGGYGLIEILIFPSQSKVFIKKLIDN